MKKRRNSVNKNSKLKFEDGQNSTLFKCKHGQESTELGLEGTHFANTEMHTIQAEYGKKLRSQSGKELNKHDVAKKLGISALKQKKASSNLSGKRSSLRSSSDGIRVLRSMSKEKVTTPVQPAYTPANPDRERRKRRKKAKRAPNDEYAAARNHLGYLLTRMSYEQNLLDAYSGEGWKGQSLEKIRPERELERAKSEILRCKLRIRDLFRHLDSLLSEGRLQDSLFDSKGEISSEDIFCAKCNLKGVSTDNDIILCDGICDRGFHQKCLNPPLLTENIPFGDEGWLCPGCICKVDFIDLVNEFQRNRLRIEDSWEKVFPEASAIANGDKQYDYSVLPSDDSEDDDYDPDVQEIDAQNQEERSSSEESDFTSSSEDLGNLKSEKFDGSSAFPSDDSEDDDYDPDKLDPDVEIQKNHLSSDESNFTSDSDDFCTELCKSSIANEVSSSLLSEVKPLSEERSARDKALSLINSELILERDLNQNDIPGKRHRERFDYKKLYDGTYGNASSDSSNDEDWSNTSSPKKGKKDFNRKETTISPKENMLTLEDHPTPKRAKSMHTKDDKTAKGKLTKNVIRTKLDLPQPQSSQIANESTDKTPKKLELGAPNLYARENNKSQELYSVGKKVATSSKRSLSTTTSEKLRGCFKENQYPSRNTKESLAEELGLTMRQVSKWFERARHNMRVSSKDTIQARKVTPDESPFKSASLVGAKTPDKGPPEEASQAGIITEARISTPRVGGVDNMNRSGITTANTIHVEEARCYAVTTIEDGTKLTTTQENMSQISTCNVEKSENSGQIGNTKIGQRHARDRVKEVGDKDRQKAIARELRKRRLSR